jgi:CheY-like chemotaxis protein
MLFADVNMPGLSGRQLAERARDFRPELRVLLVSGLDTDGRGFPLLRKPLAVRCPVRVHNGGNRAKPPQACQAHCPTTADLFL